MAARTASQSSPLPKSTCARKRRPTLCSASLGQGWNQSMTVQLTSAGNLRARVRRSSPTGEKASTTWRCCRTLLRK
jgi:hypothetical protein